MKTAQKINTIFRIDANVKHRAQKAAESIDVSLSSIVNNYLYHFGNDKNLAFEYPSPKLVAMIKESEKDLKKCNTSPAFTNTKDAMKWLNSQ